MTAGVAATPAEKATACLWALAPWISIAGFVLLNGQLTPAGECANQADALGAGGTLYLVLAGVLLVPEVLGAVYLADRLRRRPEPVPLLSWALLVAALAVAAIFAFLDVDQDNLHRVGQFFVLAVPITIVFYAMAVWGLVAARGRVDKVGVLLPATLLLVAGVILVPVAWGLQELRMTGGFC
jgi:hypothetical protein